MQTHVVMVAYQRPEIILKAIERFKTCTDFEGLDFIFHVYDFGYPIPNKIANRQKVGDACLKEGIVYKTRKNAGVSGNYDQIFEDMMPKKTDIVAFFDPDSAPRDKQWLKDAKHIIEYEKAAYVTLSRPVADAAQNSEVKKKGNLQYKRLVRACGWPMGIFSGDFIRKNIGKFFNGNQYGYFENHLLELMNNSDMKGYILLTQVDDGFMTIQHEYDPIYVEWKTRWAHKRTKRSFEQYLTRQK